jgi:hypothetical protein
MHCRLPFAPYALVLWCAIPFSAPLDALGADARPGVLPIVFGLDTESAEAAGAVRVALTPALRTGPRHQFVHPVDAFDPEGQHERDTALREGAAAMAAGHRAFEALEDGLGSADFARAENAYLAAGPNAHASFVQARVLRLAVRWPEDPASVRRALPDLFSLAPDAVFPADFTPSDLAREAAKAREAVNAAAKGTLDVNSTPPGAQLFVDGVARGTTPVSIGDLAKGEHQIALFAPGHRWRRSAVSVGPNTRGSYALEVTRPGRGLLELESLLARRFGRPEEGDAVRSAAGMLPAAELLVAGVRRDGRRWTVTLQRFALPDAHVHGVETLVVLADAPDRDKRLQAAVTRLLTKDRPRGRDGSPAGMPTGLLSVASLRPATLRPLLGASAIALVAGGVGVGLSARQAEHALRSTPQTDDRLSDLQWSVYRRALVSDALTAAGLLTGVAWSWWRFGAPGEAGEPTQPRPVSAPAADPAPDAVPPLLLPDDPFSATPPEARRTVWTVLAGPAGLGLTGAF